MRILITSDVFPPEAGGPATYVPLIARELVALGHTVRVVTYSHDALSAADTTYPFEVQRIKVQCSRPLRLLRAGIRIAYNARCADLIYVNGLLVECALTNVLLRRPAAAKVVGDIAWERARDKGWTSNSFEEFQRRRYSWPIELRRYLRSWALRRMKAVIVPSQFLSQIVASWGLDEDRVHVVYNAYEPDTARGAPMEIPLHTRHRLVTVCRLTAWKGVDELIGVVASLPDAGLAVIGDGPERAKLGALVERLGVTERVFFSGQVPHGEIGGYLRACDLFVLNSRYEGLPHVLLEAMAAGLPIVATDVGGIAEVVQSGQNGQLVEPGNQAQLRAAIHEVLDNQELRGRCARSRFQVADRFSTRTMAKTTEQILQSAAG